MREIQKILRKPSEKLKIELMQVEIIGYHFIFV